MVNATVPFSRKRLFTQCETDVLQFTASLNCTGVRFAGSVGHIEVTFSMDILDMTASTNSTMCEGKLEATLCQSDRERYA